MGELLSHRLRIVNPARRKEGSLRPMGWPEALAGVLEAAQGRGILLFLDANLPCEQLVAADAWCRAWPSARLCLVMEPGDEQMLLGAEAAAAEHLSDEALADCDGFLIVGDAFAANPRCSRGVFERRAAEPRTPIVAIDPGGGTAAKFATHCVPAAPGAELQALASVALAAGIDMDVSGLCGAGETPASAAGKALAGCRRLGVLLAAEYGRTSAWRQVGYLAGRLAAARGGGVACQTAGANALGAVRCAAGLETVPLAEAVADEASAWVVLGCDLLGMLGWCDRAVLAAAAPLPNTTTEAAEFVLPAPLPVEMGGTYVLSGGRQVASQALLAPPAGVATPLEIIEQMARSAGVASPEVPGIAAALEARPAEAPELVAAEGDPGQPLLLFARQALHAGSGALTRHGSWQQGAEGRMELRVSPADADEMDLRNLQAARVEAGGRSAAAQVRVSDGLPGGAVVLPEGFVEARALAPCRAEADRNALVATPAAVKIEA